MSRADRIEALGAIAGQMSNGFDARHTAALDAVRLLAAENAEDQAYDLIEFARGAFWAGKNDEREIQSPGVVRESRTTVNESLTVREEASDVD
ncbi:hypothetical protein [Patulibacter minatonensis]|uniref:hypothetical protein n=1 Tax=Patulibacter minatonensis TaxID=298163 RepID=UPI00047C613A|nr:hypothetical protein [Patulibacter minatonensis]